MGGSEGPRYMGREGLGKERAGLRMMGGCEGLEVGGVRDGKGKAENGGKEVGNGKYMA